MHCKYTKTFLWKIYFVNITSFELHILKKFFFSIIVYVHRTILISSYKNVRVKRVYWYRVYFILRLSLFNYPDFFLLSSIIEPYIIIITYNYKIMFILKFYIFQNNIFFKGIFNYIFFNIVKVYYSVVSAWNYILFPIKSKTFFLKSF